MPQDKDWRYSVTKFGWLAIPAWLMIVLVLPTPSNEFVRYSTWLLPIFGVVAIIAAFKSWKAQPDAKKKGEGNDNG